MCPLKPAIGTIHPRQPRPRATRAVQCPGCGHGFEVSQRAQVIRCPRCTAPMRFEDVVVRHMRDDSISTMGHVHVTQTSVMTGKVTCGKLTNDGQFDGDAMVYGPIHLLPDSLTLGMMHGSSLTVHRGAVVRGRASIQPARRTGSLP